MSNHRVLVDAGALVAGVAVPIDADEGHHLRVRRAEAGERVELFDGAGATGSGVLVKQGKGWQVEVQQVERHPVPTPLILAVGAGDRDRFLFLSEKCTELGVTRLIPLITERSVTVETRLRESGVEKCRKRAREACKQSGNPWATEVAELTPLMALPEDGVRWLLADPDGSLPARVEGGTPLGWLVGPEGGLSPSEVADAVTRLRAHRVRFSPHVLRFETAALVAAWVLSFGAFLPEQG